MIKKIDINNDEIVGRLGNKLFQIAAGYSIAKQIGTEFVIPDWKYRKIFPNVKIDNDVSISKIYTEPSFTYSKPPVELFQGNVQINGYFQSDKYFSSREDILALFEFSDYINSMTDIAEKQLNINVKDYISIHIRRGDYVNLQHFYENLSNTEYYIDSINKCGEKKFIVFSDDIDFCIQYFSQFQGCEFVYSDNLETVDLCLMSRCKGNIIANSSFSWWGAYLNKNAKFVYMPKSWFKCELDSKDLFVKGWNLI